MSQKFGKYGEPQKCFFDGVYVYCNFVTRNGIAIYSPNGWMKFLPGGKKKVQTEDEDDQKNEAKQKRASEQEKTR